jgi:peptide/nickel transport system permease protein
MGVKPPEPVGGNLLIGAQNYLWTAPWLVAVPSAAITRTILAVFRLGDNRGQTRFRSAGRHTLDGSRP